MLHNVRLWTRDALHREAWSATPCHAPRAMAPWACFSVSKDPWIKFFPSDFLSGVAGLSAAERGVYITLLASMYDHAGPIKRDDGRLARLCGLPTPGFTRAIECLIDACKLVQTNGWIFNERVKNQLHERENRKLMASDNSKSRWVKPEQIQLPHDATASQNGCETHATRAIESEPESESDKNQVAIATSSTGAVDLFPESKKLVKAESDQRLLDEVTDVWNVWAAKNGARQVKFLTGERAVKCRRRLADITNGHGPIAAFEELLVKCEQSFFVKGTPRSKLGFDQLLEERFFVKLMEDGFKYEARGNAWQR